jgi:response regulator RpfG family c-di-GMP phosphodiesterase
VAHILVVDGERDSLLMLQRLLERVGHRVMACSRGTDALGLVGGQDLDLAVVCETAGHRDTVGLAHRLKQTNPRLTVMSITDTIAGRTPDAGRVDDFLLRPIDLDMIEGKVRELLSLRNTGEPG